MHFNHSQKRRNTIGKKYNHHIFVRHDYGFHFNDNQMHTLKCKKEKENLVYAGAESTSSDNKIAYGGQSLMPFRQKNQRRYA